MNATSPAPLAAESKRPPLFLAGYGLLFFLVSALFYLWALPNNLNDILIKQFMDAFDISRYMAGLVQSAFYLGYFLLAIPAALLMQKRGYKAGLVTGLLLFAGGAFLFWPAALEQSYAFFLMALFVIASGLSFLETGANSFIAHLGDASRSEQRLNLAQSFNPLGSITAVWIGTYFIFSGVELSPAQVAAAKRAGTYAAYVRSENLRVIPPYLVIAGTLLVMALLIGLAKFPAETAAAEDALAVGKGSFSRLFRYRHLVLAVIAQFFYVGAQVGTWSYTIAYVQSYTQAGEKVAGYVLTASLVLFALGRWVSTGLMRYVSPGRLMGIYCLVNVGLLAVAAGAPRLTGLTLHLRLAPGWGGVDALALSSFFMSLMFPTIFALGVKQLGPDRKLGGSIIIMAIIGGGVLTPIIGLISKAGMATAMIVPLACYAFIAWFSFAGAKVRAVSPAA